MGRWLLACVGVLGLAGCLEPEDPLYPRRDTDPPEVSATEPAAGVTIGRTAELRITFSERMDERTLRPGIAVFAGREEVALGLTVPPGREGEVREVRQTGRRRVPRPGNGGMCGPLRHFHAPRSVRGGRAAR